MRVLLDECLPVRLRSNLPDHDARTVQYMGWKGVKNGALLALMREAAFEVFLATDSNLEFQQNVRNSGIALLCMEAPSNRIRDLLPLLPQLQCWEGSNLARLFGLRCEHADGSRHSRQSSVSCGCAGAKPQAADS